MASLTFEAVSKTYADGTKAVDALDLRIPDGEFMVLVGPSGCGKTTALRMLAGLEEISDGVIRIGAHVVNDVPPRDRDIAMVFQNYALYPHMSVFDNMAFALTVQKVAKREVDRRVRTTAGIIGLEQLLERRPGALSGGQRQRVAMGRAIVRQPKAFLMDEPLSNLDAKLRVQMRAELATLHERLATTTVYVTHDQVEAMTLGQRVAVLRDGVLQQVDTPQALYNTPTNLFVAAFIGSPPMNLVEAEIQNRGVSFAGFTLPVPEQADLSVYRGRSLILGIRPSDMEDADVWQSGSLPVIDVKAHVTEELGSEVNVLFRVDAPPVATADTVAAASEEGEEGAVIPLLIGEGQSMFCARVDARTAARPGAPVRLSVDPSRFHYFDKETGMRIGSRRAGTPVPIASSNHPS